MILTFLCIAILISIHTTTQVVTYVTSVNRTTLNISIHTTTQVVTDSPIYLNPSYCISIHTTTQVVTIQDGTD